MNALDMAADLRMVSIGALRRAVVMISLVSADCSRTSVGICSNTWTLGAYLYSSWQIRESYTWLLISRAVQLLARQIRDPSRDVQQEERESWCYLCSWPEDQERQKMALQGFLYRLERLRGVQGMRGCAPRIRSLLGITWLGNTNGVLLYCS